MTVEELRTVAKEMGYKLMPIQPYEKLKVCVCGCKQREHWYGPETVQLKCKKCGLYALGRTEAEARREWNSMIAAMRAGEEYK